LRIVPTLAVTLSLAVGAPALAQNSGVAVDYGALDATAPSKSAPGEAAPVVLKPPLAPVVLQPPPVPKRAAMAVPPPPPPKAIPPALITPARAPAPVPPAIARPSAPVPPAAPQPTPAAAPAAVAAPAAAMLRFAKSDSALSTDGRTTLDRVAAALAANESLRLQLVAHASGDADDPVVARRVALQRAIAARTYLIEHGVQSVRMDVRALGDKDAGDGPLDRVDLLLVER